MIKASLLRVPDFRILIVTRIMAVVALQCQAVAVGWHVYELTHDPLYLGLIGLTEALPAIACAFFSGHIVDKNRPAGVYAWSVGALILNGMMIWSTVWTELPMSAGTRLFLLFSGVFFSGVARSFTSPSMFAINSFIVPRAQQAESAAWNSTAFQLAAILGPATGGWLYAAAGPVVAFAITPLFLSGAFLAVMRFSARTKSHQTITPRESFWPSIKTGIQFVRSQPVLLSAMTLDMLSVLFGGAVSILPMFSDQVLRAGSVGLGHLRAAPSIGSGLVAFTLALWPLKVISGRMLLLAVFGFGLSTIGLGLSTSFLSAFICLVFSGAFDGISLVIRSTILQLLTPEAMRGRVASLSLVFITSSNEIGAFESGLAARFLGLVPSLLFGGGMTTLVVGLTAGFVPSLRKTRLTGNEGNP